jgi:hypothetical protein
MMNVFRLTVLVATVAAAAVSIASSGVVASQNRIDVRVSPTVAMAPAYVRALVTIPREASNRLLRVSLDSGDFYRSSDLPLEGAQAAFSHQLTWRSVPSGLYVVTAELYASGELKEVVRREIRVVGLE